MYRQYRVGLEMHRAGSWPALFASPAPSEWCRYLQTAYFFLAAFFLVAFFAFFLAAIL
jgi:hypothetical protein